MAKNPNENGSYEVIHASKYCKGSKTQGEKKMRLVVIRFNNTSKPMRYAIRWQDWGGDNAPTYGGGAFMTEESAYDRFLINYADHNKMFRRGNCSNLPGIAKRD